MARLFRIIGSSDPERKLNGAGTHSGSWWAISTWVVRDTGVSYQIESCIFRSGSFIAPRSLQLCLSQPAQKTFLGGVLLAEFPHGGLECSHLALPDREILQVNQKSDRLVIFIGLPLLDVRCNLIPSRFFAILQLVQIASAVGLVFCFPARSFCRSLRLQ